MKQGSMIITIAVVVALVCYSATFHAKDEDKNRFHIDQSLYEIYTRAYKLMHDTMSTYPALSDSLFRVAQQMGEQKAQCLALDLDCTYAMKLRPHDEDYIHSYIDRERRFAEKTPYQQYVFGGWGRHIITLIDRRDMRCIDEIEEFQHEAFRLRNGYGMAKSYEFYAALYRNLGLYQSSITANGLAIDYQTRYGNPNELYRFYFNMGQLYFVTKDNKQAIDYIDRSLASKYKTTNIELKSYDIKARIYYRKHDKQKFAENVELYEKLIEKSKKFVIEDKIENLYFLKSIYYNYVEYDTAKAHALCLKIKDKRIRSKALLSFYEYTKNYEQAFKTKNLLDSINKQTSAEDQLYQISNIQEMIKHNALELRRSEIEQANLKLSEQQEAMAAALAREQLEIEQKNKQKNQLYVETQLAQLDNVRRFMAKQKLSNETKLLEEKKKLAHIDAQNSKLQQLHLTISGSVVLLLIAMAFCATAIHMQAKRTKTLKRKHQTALASLRMKEHLIEQMHHHLTLPLQQLQEYVDDMSPKQHFDTQQTDHIHNYTNNITTIVDKLIDECPK